MYIYTCLYHPHIFMKRDNLIQYFHLYPSSLCIFLNIVIKRLVAFAFGTIILMNRLYRLNKGRLVNIPVNSHPMAFSFCDSFRHHPVIQALEILVCLLNRVYQKLLLSVRHPVPGSGADDINIR